MNRAQLKAIGKLALVLGVPISLVLLLFGTGVYCGATHRHGITSFEHDVLGMDVEVAPAPVEPSPSATASTPSTPATSEPPKADTPTPAPTPTPTPTPPPPTTTTLPPTTATPEPAPKVDPVAGDLAARLALPVTVRVKVLVDDELITEHEDWIDYVQRTVSRSSKIYEEQFGIELQLAGVGRWQVAAAGMRVDALLDDLRARPREGADILLGMTARPLDGAISGQAETPTDASAFNGAHAIVYAVPGMREPHLRTLLHEVSHLFGALDVTDESDPAWQAGSWMSYAPASDDQAAWIDADNRRRVLARKDKPFAPADTKVPAGNGGAATPSEDDGDEPPAKTTEKL